jgi:hypothetical protein
VPEADAMLEAAPDAEAMPEEAAWEADEAMLEATGDVVEEAGGVVTAELLDVGAVVDTSEVVVTLEDTTADDAREADVGTADEGDEVGRDTSTLDILGRQI